MKTDINPALKPIEMLVGAWDMELSNASFLPDAKATIHGRVSFEWFEGGDFLIVRQGAKKGGTPWATWFIGRDADSANYTVLYFDNRQVSRVYQMSFEISEWKIWRTAPGFSQRFVGKVDNRRKTIKAFWEKSTDGKRWERDFDVNYTKAEHS